MAPKHADRPLHSQPAVSAKHMIRHPKQLFSRLSLSRQFLMVSFPILLVATLVVGWWVGQQVQDSVVHKIGSVTGLYIDSFVSPHVQRLATADDLSLADREALGALLTDTPLGQKIVAFKIWRPDGLLLFSSDGKDVGRTFPIEEGLVAAIAGNIFSEIVDRSEQERQEHGAPMARLIETYTPLHAGRAGTVVAAAEFYAAADEVDREAGVVQRRSWLILAGTMLAAYLLLFLIVRRGSRTIDVQQRELRQNVALLTALNAQNVRLTERVRRAAERTTALNENFLHRISTDIHDGPGQDLGFALMQLKSFEGCIPTMPRKSCVAESLEPARHAVQSALDDLRRISANLQLPDLARLSLKDVAARVVRDYESKTGSNVTLDAPARDVSASMRVKVTLYRVLQESLANALRHAHCKNPRVRIQAYTDAFTLEVSDDGPGFDMQWAETKGGFGLAGMRERVEIIGGTFRIESDRDKGTTIRALLPLTTPEAPDV